MCYSHKLSVIPVVLLAAVNIATVIAVTGAALLLCCTFSKFHYNKLQIFSV